MTMECPTDEVLNQFLEGELADELVAELNAHLESCEVCQAKLDALTESHLGVALPDVAVTDPTISNLVSRLSVLSPSRLEGDAVTSSGVHFPGPPTDEAPLGELDPYKIQELIGDGASGLLYRAIDPRIDREVAIKVLRSELASQDESRQRLNREARAVAGLTHENVVQLYEFGNAHGFPPYLVMECINGESISQRLKRVQVIPPKTAVEFAIPVARALAVAHKQNLIHRDVKPSNILLDETNKPKITDFGLALLDDGNSELTREGSLAGTPAYISPEQILDPHNVDGRTDTYGLGVVLYQMLTGELPFQGVVRMTLLAVLHKDPPQPRQYNDEIPRDLETIVLKAMSKDRDKRYATADDFADDLQRWQNGEPIHARPVGKAERFWRWCKRNPWVAGLSTAVALLLTTVTIGSVIASVNLSTARKRAEQAATAAEAQRDQAFETLNSLVYEVNEKFEDDVTDVDEIQKSVLNISVRGLREIASKADGEGRVDVSTAAAHIRLGMVLARLDDVDEAEQHFDRGDEILERLGGETSGKWPVVKLVIESLWSRSDLAYYEDDNGRCDKLMADAVAVARRTHDRSPDNFEAHLTLARAQSKIADHLYNEEYAGVEQAAATALKTLIELEEKYPDSDRVFYELTNMYDTNAAHAYSEENFDDALKYFGILVQRCNSALEEDPYASNYADWLIQANHVLGDICRQRGDKKTAIEYLVKAMEAEDRYEHWIAFETIQSIQRDLDELRDEMKMDL